MMESPGSTGFVDDELDLRGDLVDALNEAKTAAALKDKLRLLKEASEIALHRDESRELLESFAKDFADFHTDKKAAMRLFVVQFIEDACKVCKDAIPVLFSPLVALVNDRNNKNRVKVWVTAMNLFRPALALLSSRAFYEAEPAAAQQLASDLAAIKDEATTVLSDPKRFVMPIVDTVKTIALSYLLPNPEDAKIIRDEVERGPRKARVDTGPDSFTLAMIPRDHPVLTVVELEKVGIALVQLLCKQLAECAQQGDQIRPDAAVKSIPLVNAVQVLALHRPGVRDEALDTLLSCAEHMKMEDGDDVSHNKLRFVQNLRTNYLGLLKEKWRELLKPWRARISDALGLVGARDQAEKALQQLTSKDARTQKRLERAERELQRRQEEEMRRRQAEERRSNVELPEALDAEELRRKDYPRQRNTLTPEEIRELYTYPSSDIALLVIRFMENLPGVPPESSVSKPESEAISTFAQFVSFIEGRVSSLSEQGSKDARQAANALNLTAAIGSRREALDRLLDQHREHVPSSALAVFSSKGLELPSSGDVLIARMACDFERRADAGTDLDLRPVLLAFVARDLHTRFGLALSALFHVFAYNAAGKPTASFSQYDELFTKLMELLLAQQDQEQRKSDDPEDTPLAPLHLRQDAIGRLFLRAPRLPPVALSVLVHFCETQGKHMLGLKTLRDLVHTRGAMRQECLDALLFFAVNGKRVIRDDAIRCVANQVYPALDAAWRAKAEAFAFGMLESCLAAAGLAPEASAAPDAAVGETLAAASRQVLAGASDGSVLREVIKVEEPAAEEAKQKEEEKKEEEVEEAKDDAAMKDVGEGDLQYEREEGFVKVEGENKASEADLLRRIDLYVALSRRNSSELLKGYMDVFARAEDEALRKVMENAVVLLIQVLGRELGPAETLSLFQDFPDGAIPLVIHALKLLVNESICDSRPKRQALVAQARCLEDQQKQYLLFDTDDRFVIPLLGSLTRTEIERYLISIVSMDRDSVKAAINSIIVGARFASVEDEEEEGLDAQPFLPNELFVKLVNLPESDEVTAQNLIDATELCFERRDVFTKDVMIAAVQELILQEKLPRLLMRVMMRCIDKQPQTKQFMAEALSALVDRQIWEMDDEDLWKGFVMCAIKLSTPALPILFRLPVDQLRSVFSMCKELGGEGLAKSLLFFARNNREALNLSTDVLELLETIEGKKAVPVAAEQPPAAAQEEKEKEQTGEAPAKRQKTGDS